MALRSPALVVLSLVVAVGTPASAVHPAPRHATPPGDLTVSVQASPVAAPTATFVDIIVAIKDSKASSYSLTISLGDGQAHGVAQSSYCLPGAESGELDVRLPIRHAYRHAGPAAIAVFVETEDCDAEKDTASAATAAVITPGERPSNGPRPPQLHLAQHRHDSRNVRKIVLPMDVADDDGTLHRLTVEWGDTTSTAIGPASCSDPVLTWPSYRQHVEPLHTYARPGRYQVRVTATSTGCDGTTRQTVVARRSVVVGRGAPPRAE